MALLRGQLRGSDEVEVVWPREADGNRYFSGSDVRRGLEDAAAYKSRALLVHMAPQTFLQLALPFKFGPRDDSTALVSRLVAEGRPFSSIPRLFLDATDDDHTARVVGHEGRHRSNALIAAGIRAMPVILSHRSLRWSQRKGTFDYKPWPTYLISEDGTKTLPAERVGLTPELRAAVQGG